MERIKIQIYCENTFLLCEKKRKAFQCVYTVQTTCACGFSSNKMREKRKKCKITITYTPRVQKVQYKYTTPINKIHTGSYRLYVQGNIINPSPDYDVGRWVVFEYQSVPNVIDGGYTRYMED